MNLHRNHSNPKNRAAPSLRVNQHLKQCAGGYLHVFPFFIVPTQHQISKESYEKYFQDLLKHTLHLRPRILPLAEAPDARGDDQRL